MQNYAYPLSTTILLEGFNQEKERIRKLLEAKYKRLQYSYSEDITKLGAWKVEKMNKEAEELTVLLGFMKQVDNLISAITGEVQDIKEAQQWWLYSWELREWIENRQRVHTLSAQYKNIVQEFKRVNRK